MPDNSIIPHPSTLTRVSPQSDYYIQEGDNWFLYDCDDIEEGDAFITRDEQIIVFKDHDGSNDGLVDIYNSYDDFIHGHTLHEDCSWGFDYAPRLKLLVKAVTVGIKPKYSLTRFLEEKTA